MRISGISCFVAFRFVAGEQRESDFLGCERLWDQTSHCCSVGNKNAFEALWRFERTRYRLPTSPRFGGREFSPHNKENGREFFKEIPIVEESHFGDVTR